MRFFYAVDPTGGGAGRENRMSFPQIHPHAVDKHLLLSMNFSSLRLFFAILFFPPLSSWPGTGLMTFRGKGHGSSCAFFGKKGIIVGNQREGRL